MKENRSAVCAHGWVLKIPSSFQQLWLATFPSRSAIENEGSAVQLAGAAAADVEPALNQL
jgi:hypothetical protein